MASIISDGPMIHRRLYDFNNRAERDRVSAQWRADNTFSLYKFRKRWKKERKP